MTLWAAVLLVAAVATHEDDIYAPIFHVSPAGCGGGWLNDPNAPFEFKGRHHLFYQYARDDAPGPGPGGRLISWGHVAGNLSHARCLPPALVPGVDGDGSPTPYDAQGVFTGSVTVVGGRPVATYPAMPGSHMASARPADPDDPDLVRWTKDPRNPLDGDVRGGPLAGPLGCTAAWREGGTWTTTIEGGRPLAVKFFASADFVAWDEEGDLDCPACAACAVPCSDFYPLADRWVFGINSFGCHLASGGAVVGELGENRTFTVAGARAREVAAELAAGSTANASFFAYDYGAAKYPKGYETSDGRRIQYAWLDEPADTPKNQTWLGAQTAPRVVAPARADDPSTSVLVNPVAELAALRTSALAADASAAGTGAWAAAGVAGRHLDTSSPPSAPRAAGCRGSTRRARSSSPSASGSRPSASAAARRRRRARARTSGSSWRRPTTSSRTSSRSGAATATTKNIAKSTSGAPRRRTSSRRSSGRRRV